MDSSESSVVSVFKEYELELTASYDKRERVIRLSRDVTIESKRIIFYLHSLKREEVESELKNAEKRINALAEGWLAQAAAELQTGDWLHVRVSQTVSPAVEELAEAYCLLTYLKNESPLDLACLQNLQQLLGCPKVDGHELQPRLHIDPLTFLLGVADFTGELMRTCIHNSSIEGDDSCHSICKLMREIYIRLTGTAYNRELKRKMMTLLQSLQKVENTCYKHRLRQLKL